MDTQTIIDTEDAYQLPTYNKLPIALEKGQGSYVTDTDGNTPLRYQPFLLDPTGRYLGIDLRKMF